MEYFNLIEQFISDINHLEAKVVYLRYLLSWHIDDHTGAMLRCDIFHDLAAPYYGPAFDRFVSKYSAGHDPRQCPRQARHLWRISKGKEAVDY
jgi:hypothetical protein